MTTRKELTKYSEVLPDGSFTPPPNIVDDVLWIWGVECRVWLELDVAPPPLRIVVPRNQPFLFDMVAF